MIGEDHHAAEEHQEWPHLRRRPNHFRLVPLQRVPVSQSPMSQRMWCELVHSTTNRIVQIDMEIPSESC